MSCYRFDGNLRIKETYKNLNAVPKDQTAAASCILIAAICTHLIDTREDETTMIHLYKAIDVMTADDAQAISETENSMLYRQQLLDSIRIEFIHKARNYAKDDEDFATAKKTAKCMLLDYCKSYLTKLEKA